MNEKTQAGKPVAARTLRTGNATARQVRACMEEIRDTLDYPRSQMPGETLTHFIARQKRNAIVAAKAMTRESFTVQAETILLGRVAK